MPYIKAEIDQKLEGKNLSLNTTRLLKLQMMMQLIVEKLVNTD
jgi:hypothetical protein